MGLGLGFGLGFGLEFGLLGEVRLALVEVADSEEALADGRKSWREGGKAFDDGPEFLLAFYALATLLDFVEVMAGESDKAREDGGWSS